MSENHPNVSAADDLTYNDYLKVPELLQLQVLQSEPEHHDEMLFIVIHQTYELWFMLILRELEKAMTYMDQGKVLRARHFVQRVVEILKVLVAQIHILETMKPVEFLQFRHRLMPASGFQSIQFREMEFLCGMKDARYLRFFENRPDLQERLQLRLDARDIRQTYYQMLRSMGYALPEDISVKALDADEEARSQVLRSLLPLYQDPEENLPLNLLSESMISMDQNLAHWREHHVRVVERVIGHKRGTGGSQGVCYLQSTTSKKAFPLLWEVRTVLEVNT
jgi:tryptophan 2,3-dioxygenase